MFLVYFTSYLLFLSPNGLQEDSLPFNNTFNALEELNQIPGTTMGQKLESLLFWEEEEKKRRFPRMHLIYPSHPVEKGNTTFSFEINPTNRLTLEQLQMEHYMDQQNIGGILVLQNHKILLEEYAAGIDSSTLWTSFSVAKSVTSMLLGAALKDGYIHSLEDPLEKYIEALKGEDYGKVTVKQLLTMTSGISWNEDYTDPHSDVAQMYQAECQEDEAHILTYMKPLKFTQPPGTHFNYSTGETDLLGILIQKATGKTLATYLSESIWKTFGMGQKAYWLADECSGMNIGGSGLSASLRDYGRIGAMMLEESKQPNYLAKEWVEHATSLIMKTGENNSGYGYLWWIDEKGNYLATGIFGQMIYVNPIKNLVIVQFASWPQAGSKALLTERATFIQAIEEIVKINN